MMRAVRVDVAFGPSTSLHAGRLVGERGTLDHRAEASFALEGDDAGDLALVLGPLARLLRVVAPWRSTEVFVDDEPELPTLVEAMAWCSHRYAVAGGCTFRYYTSVPDRCRVCPLFDPARAEREVAATRAGLPLASAVPDTIPDGWDLPPG